MSGDPGEQFENLLIPYKGLQVSGDPGERFDGNFGIFTVNLSRKKMKVGYPNTKVSRRLVISRNLAARSRGQTLI